MPPHKGIALVKTNALGSVRLRRVIDIYSSLISSGWSMAHWLSNTDPGTGDGRWRCSPALKSIMGTKATLKCHDWFTQSVQSTAVAFPFTGVRSRRVNPSGLSCRISRWGNIQFYCSVCEWMENNKIYHISQTHTVQFAHGIICSNGYLRWEVAVKFLFSLSNQPVKKAERLQVITSHNGWMLFPAKT